MPRGHQHLQAPSWPVAGPRAGCPPRSRRAGYSCGLPPLPRPTRSAVPSLPAPMSRGIYLEGPFFTQKHVGAQNPEYLIDLGRALRDWRGRRAASARAPWRPSTTAPWSTSPRCRQGRGHLHRPLRRHLRPSARCRQRRFHVLRAHLQRHAWPAPPRAVGCAMTTPQTPCRAHQTATTSCLPPPTRFSALRAGTTVLITDALGCAGSARGRVHERRLACGHATARCYLRDGGNLASGSVATMAEVAKNVYDWGHRHGREQAIRISTRSRALDASPRP